MVVVVGGGARGFKADNSSSGVSLPTWHMLKSRHKSAQVFDFAPIPYIHIHASQRKRRFASESFGAEKTKFWISSRRRQVTSTFRPVYGRTDACITSDDTCGRSNVSPTFTGRDLGSLAANAHDLEKKHTHTRRLEKCSCPLVSFLLLTHGARP